MVGGEEGGGEGEQGSDTVLCVTMVQALSELHRSFAAQLANYTQTAVLMCSSLFLFYISAPVHEQSSILCE